MRIRQGYNRFQNQEQDIYIREGQLQDEPAAAVVQDQVVPMEPFQQNVVFEQVPIARHLEFNELELQELPMKFDD